MPGLEDVNLTGEKVLIVEDNQDIREGLLLTLGDAGYTPLPAADGREALRLFYEQQPGVILLDLMLPGMSGTEVCKRVRTVSDTPVIILSAVDDEAQKIHSLTIGADDYIVKGAGIGELLARIRACIRRVQINRTERKSTHYSDAVLQVDFTKQAVKVNGRDIELTPIEFRLLSELVRHEGRPLSSAELLETVWGKGYETDSLVKWHISRLRRKLGAAMRRPDMDMIVTRRGYGYAYLEQAAA
jgi:DNA-binding response OmpR family regulator